MANFIKLKVKNGIFEEQYINMDLVQEIVPAQRNDYGARLIFVGVDREDNDYMYSDVMETPEEILRKI